MQIIIEYDLEQASTLQGTTTGTLLHVESTNVRLVSSSLTFRDSLSNLLYVGAYNTVE